MKILISIFMSLRLLIPAILLMGKWAFYAFKFIRLLAIKPWSWVIIAFLPLVDLVIGMFTGKSFINTIVTQIIMTVVNKVLQLTFDVDIQTLADALPQTVLQVSCYMGITEAIQIIFDGLITAMCMFTLLQINVLIAKMNWNFVLKIFHLK